MKKTAKNILEKAREMFNEKGVANVSIREVARELGISHSNLIYYFKDKNALIENLHDQIFEAAVQINQDIAQAPPLKSIFVSTLQGFPILYAYRFFMLDMVWIVRENKSLHTKLLEVEKHRYRLYEEKIAAMLSDGMLKQPDRSETYPALIEHIKTFSDTWLIVSNIYDSEPEKCVNKYVKLLLLLFHPHLTDLGKAKFDGYMDEFGL